MIAGSRRAAHPRRESEEIGFSVDRVTHRFETRNGSTVALRDVSFVARPLEFLSVVGPSGCGKTTLLKILAGLIEPSSGAVSFRGGGSDGVPPNALVFQEHGVFPWMSVLDNVAFGLEMGGVDRNTREARAFEFIERVGLASFARHYPHDLSSGMRQRVGVARAFVADVPLLLMDEPFGALDAQTKLALQEELLRIWSTDRKLVVFVTHDLQEAVRLGDRVIVLSGRPGTVGVELAVPIPRPRDPARDRAEVTELSWQLWNLLEEGVREDLSMDR